MYQQPEHPTLADMGKERNWSEIQAIRMLTKVASSKRLSDAQRNAIVEARNRLHVLVQATRRYSTRYMVDEAEPDGPHITGCSQAQSDDAQAVFEALSFCNQDWP